MLNPTTLAIPIFFLLIAIELILNYFQKAKLYRLNDSITNINAGSSQQIVGILMKLVGVGLYEILYQQHSFRLIDNAQFSWFNFGLCFLGYDFCYYWGHRMSHEINLFWSGHVVHHQSEEYNLSVALRQSWFQAVWTAPFYLPLALIGFSPTEFVFASGINLIYQFWIHTEFVKKMGVLEWIMNTPSHHRVHHGRNPEYIDKNHAGVFIIWDRMFGTFQEEKEAPVYGITTPINSWNPIWANFSHFQTIGEQLKETKTFSDVFKVLFYKPGYSAKLAAYIPAPEVHRNAFTKYDTVVPKTIGWYALFQYLLATIGTALFLFQINTLPWDIQVIASSLVLVYVLNIGGLFEQRKWIYYFEYLRVLGSLILISFVISSHPNFQSYVIVFSSLLLTSWVWLFSFRKYFMG